MAFQTFLKAARSAPVLDVAPVLKVATVLLAGGRGRRLHQLTDTDSKPALPFAGANRVIDFAMSNAVRSGVTRMLVATQHAPHSLRHHLPTRWGHRFAPGGLMLRDGRGMFRGTADAVRHGWDAVQAMGGDQVLILAADHVCQIDYAALLTAHRDSGAAVTVAMDRASPPRTSGFDVLRADDLRADERGRVPSLRETPTDLPGTIERPDRAGASTGICVFDREWLRNVLFADTAPLDFARDVIPHAVAQGVAGVWQLPAGTYWRNVGTLDALRLSQLDFVAAEPVRLPFPCDASDWYLGRGSIAMAGAVVPRSARLTSTLVAPGTQVPPGLVTGDDASQDARWFTRTPAGTILITQAMLDRRAAHAHIRRSVTPPSFTRRGLYA